MSRVIYGADAGTAIGANPQLQPGAIELEIIKSQPCSFKPVFDGGTRLYDQIDYDCIAYVNPQATAYTPAPRANPIARKGTRPVDTIAAIQARLCEPRRQFHMIVDGKPIISSPAMGMKCDAAAGPFPTKFEIVEITGTQTFVVRFGIRLCVNPCKERTQYPAAILSHRWKQERDVDIDGFSTLITNGHAIFDMAALIDANSLADDFWDAMVRPLETGFRRDSVQVTVTELGEELSYAIVDRETALTQRVLGVSRIEATYTVENTSMGPFFGAKIGAAGGSEKGKKVLGPVGWLAGALLGGSLGAVDHSIPGQTHTVTVRVWGRHGAKKQDLARVGQRMIAILLINADVGTKANFSANVFRITRDINGRWVEVTRVITCPSKFQAAEFLAAEGKPVWPKTPTTDDVIDLANGQEFLADAVGDNPDPGGGVGLAGGPSVGRGSWIGRIVAQRLTSACAKQLPPTRNIRGSDRIDTGGI